MGQRPCKDLEVPDAVVRLDHLRAHQARNLLKVLLVVRHLTAHLHLGTKEGGDTHREVTFRSNSGEAALHQAGKEVAPACTKDLDTVALECTVVPVHPQGVFQADRGLRQR